MKVWELEEGKEYVEENNIRYKLIDGVLMYYDNFYQQWIKSTSTYNNTIIKDFTEYIPPTDWSKVEVDTKVLVRNRMGQWYRRYFARCEQDKVYVYTDGATSWSDYGSNHITTWDEVKLYTEE